MGPLLALPQTHHFCPSQLSLDPLGPDWDCPLGSKDLEEEEGPWGGGSGLPPPGCFPGSWRQDVGLDCKGSLEGAEARAWTVYGYSLLQSCLQQAGLPETQDRSQVPRTGAQGLQGGGQPWGGGEEVLSAQPASIPVKVSPFPQALAGSEAREARPVNLGQASIVSKGIWHQ